MELGIRNLAYVYLVFALVTGAFMPVMLDLSKGMQISEFFLLVYFVTVPSSLLLILLRGKTGVLFNELRNPKLLGVMVLAGFLNYLPLGYGLLYAEHFVSASLATAVIRTSPLMMLVLLPVFLRERLSIYQIFALSLGIAGICLGVTGGRLSALGSASAPIIVLLAVMAFSYAVAGVIIKKYMLDMEISIFIFGISLLSFYSVLFASTGAEFSKVTLADMAAILYVAVVFNVLNAFTYFNSLRVIRTTIVTNLYLVSPFLTFLFADIALGEAIKPYYILIALLVSAGVTIQRFDRRGGTYMKKNASISSQIYDVTGAFVNSGNIGIATAIKNGGKVLAVKVESTAESNDYAPLPQGMYTHRDNAISASERKYLSSILGAGERDTVLLGAGAPGETEIRLESAIASMQKTAHRQLPMQ